MKTSSLARRLGAMFYDSLLVLALIFLGTLPFVAMRGGEPVESGNFLHQLTLFLIVYLFFVGYWSRYGHTLGMQAWRVKLETVDGGKPGFAACSIRFFAAILSWLPVGLGFWWQLWDKDGLAWHDRLSGTVLRHYPKQQP
jgi:uncharacterized RDD family membrane protein YckC